MLEAGTVVPAALSRGIVGSPLDQKSSLGSTTACDCPGLSFLPFVLVDFAVGSQLQFGGLRGLFRPFSALNSEVIDAARMLFA